LNVIQPRAPPHQRCAAFMANQSPSRPRPKSPANDGVVLNALAFSTLLSSQETDAHHPVRVRGPPGQPLNFTRSIPSCQFRSGGIRFGLALRGSPWCLRLYPRLPNLANRSAAPTEHLRSTHI